MIADFFIFFYFHTIFTFHIKLVSEWFLPSAVSEVCSQLGVVPVHLCLSVQRRDGVD